MDHSRKRNRGLLAALAGAASFLALAGTVTALARTEPAPAAQTGPAMALPVSAALVSHDVRQYWHPDYAFLRQEEAQGGDCMLRVPADPLSARGLATPYQLSNGPNTTGCTMADAAALGAFVQATILEPGGQLAAYDPLVITAGTTPAAAPPVPDIPRGSVITIDTAFAGNIDFLTGPGAGFFTQGLPGSPFGQVAYANAAFFDFAARAEHVTPPPLGTAADGLPCPTVTDYSLVDQDPADNVTTLYDINAAGQTAEQGAIAGGTLIGVGSDNHLLDGYVDPALGCTGSEFTVPDLSSPGMTEPTEATDNLLAAADQQAPVALTPVNDPMTTVGADIDIIPGDFPSARNFSVLKTDLYRIGQDQPLLEGGTVADATGYCQGMIAAGPRVAQDAALPAETASLNVLGSGQDLSAFMLARYAASLVLLNCAQFGGVPSVTPSGSITPAASTPSAAPAVTPAGSTAPPVTPPVTPSGTPPDSTPPDSTPSMAPATAP